MECSKLLNQDEDAVLPLVLVADQRLYTFALVDLCERCDISVGQSFLHFAARCFLLQIVVFAALVLLLGSFVAAAFAVGVVHLGPVVEIMNLHPCPGKLGYIDQYPQQRRI